MKHSNAIAYCNSVDHSMPLHKMVRGDLLAVVNMHACMFGKDGLVIELQ